jgi:DNA-binding MarR family transcriptional regulator
LNAEGRHELNLLEALERDGRVTQRGLSAELGMALGLTNIYLKRLVRKGYVKCVNVKANRVHYLLTPVGIAEKMRLTYEFMEYSLRLYRESRSHLRAALQRCVAHPSRRVAIYGTGEAAELAYLCLRELSLEPVAVFDGQAGGSFLGMPIRPLSSHREIAYDLMVVATLEDPAPCVVKLRRHRIPRERLVLLRSPKG